MSHERTFLQSLSEQERNALLRGAKIFFQKGADSSDGGSLDEHVRRLDSLREIIDVDLDFAKTAPNNSQPSPRSRYAPPAVCPLECPPNPTTIYSMHPLLPLCAEAPDRAPAPLPLHQNALLRSCRPSRSANATPDTSLGVLERPLEPDSAMLESEKDLVHEVARLRVQGSALRAENDALRSHSQRLAQHVAEARTLHSDAMVENRNRQLKMAQESASTIAELEEQLARHRSALAELAAQAEGLANDNSLLATEVATLRDQKRLLEEQKTSVEERSRSVQALYLNNLEETRRTVTAHEARRERILDQIATKEVLALSQPPGEHTELFPRRLLWPSASAICLSPDPLFSTNRPAKQLPSPPEPPEMHSLPPEITSSLCPRALSKPNHREIDSSMTRPSSPSPTRLPILVVDPAESPVLSTQRSIRCRWARPPRTLPSCSRRTPTCGNG